MKKIEFYKYQGTGNDFIIIDDREEKFPVNDLELINKLCDRRFGIGSDGLMLIRNTDKADFEMVFYNPDGTKSLCGNGSRCALAFAQKMNLIEEKALFITTDGLHEGKVNDLVSLKMHAISSWKEEGKDIFMDTGSPHLVKFVSELEHLDVKTLGSAIRFGQPYGEAGGTNVNFVSVHPDHLKVRTYERGVEDETLSCGTGVVAVALSAAIKLGLNSPVNISTRGGDLQVEFEFNEGTFEHVWLKGPAKFVFKGSIDV